MNRANTAMDNTAKTGCASLCAPDVVVDVLEVLEAEVALVVELLEEEAAVAVVVAAVEVEVLTVEAVLVDDEAAVLAAVLVVVAAVLVVAPAVLAVADVDVDTATLDVLAPEVLADEVEAITEVDVGAGMQVGSPTR